MKIKILLISSLFTITSFCVGDKPNIIIILADDMGYGDPGCYNPSSKIDTPNIDRIADNGIRFTDAHTPSSVCTPTRYTLLTGRYCWRTRLKSSVLDGFSPPLIEPGRETIASLLGNNGYDTACIGKWHLGMQWTRKDGTLEDQDRWEKRGFRPGENIDFDEPITSGPLTVGFDSFYGISASLDMPPYCWIVDDRCYPQPNMVSENGEETLFLNGPQGVMSSSFTLEGVLPELKRKAVKWLNQREGQEEPYFLYLPLNSPHLPVSPSDAFKGKSKVGLYGDFVMETDDLVGALLDTLEEIGDKDDTLVLFTSDNGGLWHEWEPQEPDDLNHYKPTGRGRYAMQFGHQSNANLRGTKADIWEGGHRVPFLIQWPNRIDSGKVSEAPIELTDVFATIAEIVGDTGQSIADSDSFSFLSLLGSKEPASVVRPFLVHHSLHGMFAIRRGDWKLVEGRGSGGFSQPRLIEGETPIGQLYNLKSDPQETKNVYAAEPVKVAALGKLLDEVKMKGAREVAGLQAFSAEMTAKNADVPPGFSMDVIASEPNIRQPISFSWDHLGRLWVAECNTYSDLRFDYDLSQSDKILVFSDEDGDGDFETRRIFAENLKRLTSVVVGFGGVWALTAPDMIFIPDADSDLVPDGPPEVKLDGFEVQNTRHTIVNGLKWGPDGWLYARHGIQTTSLVGKPGSRLGDREPINTGIWRYHPQRETVERWTEGGTNPWGHDWNGEGDLFYINTVIGHLWHSIPGAYTKRMYGQHERPFLYRLIGMHADHWHFDKDGDWKLTRENVDAEDAFGGGHAHTGLMIYQGDKWPEQYRGDLFTLNFHGRRVNRESLHAVGSGWEARHESDFVKFPDTWFRGIDIMQGPDGDVYVLDWSDTGECHDLDAIDRGSGRVYRIRYGQKAPGPSAVPETFSQLDHWLRHPNVWYSRQARLLIQEKRVSNQLEAKWITGLEARFRETNDETLALRYFHALHAAGVSKPESMLADSRESIRVQSLYLLREKESLTAGEIPGLVKAAQDDTARVRLAIATLLPQMDDSLKSQIAGYLLQHAQDASDHNYPALVWYGIEPIVASAEKVRIRSLLENCHIPEIRNYIMRRLAEDYDKNRELISHLILMQPEHTDMHLSGLADGLEGVSKAKSLLNWETIASRASSSQGLNRLGAIFGDGRSLANLFEIADDENADSDARRQAVLSLGSSQFPDLKTHLMRWINDRQLSGVCAQVLARYPDLEIGRKIIGRFRAMTLLEWSRAIDVLVARPEWAGLLLDEMERGKISPETLSASQAQRIANLQDPALTKRLGVIWGEVNPAENDAELAILNKRIRNLITEENLKNSDHSAGRKLFSQRCSSCHQLYGDGNTLGPDLTGSGRGELDYLLENILYPNALVPSGYQLTTVKLIDGRTLAGTVSYLTSQHVALNVAGADEPIKIEASEIASLTKSSQSIMPSGLVNDLNDGQMLDLFGYLMGEHQVPMED